MCLKLHQYQHKLNVAHVLFTGLLPSLITIVRCFFILTTASQQETASSFVLPGSSPPSATPWPIYRLRIFAPYARRIGCQWCSIEVWDFLPKLRVTTSNIFLRVHALSTLTNRMKADKRARYGSHSRARDTCDLGDMQFLITILTWTFHELC